MGLLETLFDSGTDPDRETDVEPTSDERKFAVLMNAGPDRTPTAGNGFNYVLELDDADFEAGLFLDGEATKWPDKYLSDPEHPFARDWQEIRDRDLLVGACGYCANAFETAEACSTADVRLLSDGGGHAPSVAALATDGYEILTIG